GGGSALDRPSTLRESVKFSAVRGPSNCLALHFKAGTTSWYLGILLSITPILVYGGRMQRFRLKTPGMIVLILGILIPLGWMAHTDSVKQEKASQAILKEMDEAVAKCFKEKGVPILSHGATICLDPCNVKWVE